MKKDKEKLIKNAVKSLMTMFRTAEFPAQLTQTIIRRNAEDKVPSDEWSLGNRMLMISANSIDARGYNQWAEVGRNVIKGSKAIYIFAPCTKKIKETDELTGEESEKIILVGFRPIPVFKYEDTAGKPLPEFDYKPEIYPNFFDVAEKLNLKVEYRPMQSNFLGRYMSKTKTKKIELCSQDSNVYYHELAHAVHDTFVDIKRYDKAKAEIVAEFSACVLSELSGQKGYEFQGYEYIKRYCGGEDKPEAVLKKIMGVLNDVEKIVGIILDTTKDNF